MIDRKDIAKDAAMRRAVHGLPEEGCATPPALTEEQEREVKIILGMSHFATFNTLRAAGYTISFTGKPGYGLAEQVTHVKDSECQLCHGNGFVTEEIFHKVWTPDNVSQGGGTVAETVAVPCRNCDSPWLTTTSLPGDEAP